MEPKEKAKTMRAMLHPNWVQAFKDAVRSRGQAGYSAEYHCLTHCPVCGSELCAEEDVLYTRTLSGRVVQTASKRSLAFCLHCDQDDRSLAFYERLESLAAYQPDALGLFTLNRELPRLYLSEAVLDEPLAWEPSARLTHDCLLGQPLALLFQQLIAEAIDEHETDTR